MLHEEDDKLAEEMKRSEENKKKLEKTIIQNETIARKLTKRNYQIYKNRFSVSIL